LNNQNITGKISSLLGKLYNTDKVKDLIQLQKTRKDFEGDFTLVVFPLLKYSKKSPEETANEIGDHLTQELTEIRSFNVVKGFLNLVMEPAFWSSVLLEKLTGDPVRKEKDKSKNYVVEYSSPNTNKPLHLGHIRNNLIGFSISRILESIGNTVHKVNIVNDRGIHICKSMLAWMKWGNGATPKSAGKKGDHLVGDFYVKFDQEYKKQVAELVRSGFSPEKAQKEALLIIEAQQVLRKWEDHDEEVRSLWETMNNWVYEGFDATYKKLGVEFDKIYYESETYKLGRELVLEGLEKGIFSKKEDGSIWADLSDKGLDQKLLLRSDGTSVYITQDLGTANERYEDYGFDSHIYVVGNEQNYHFQVLKLLLEKLNYDWAESLYHLSYGMVELPHGKMKSREGTVVDADILIEEMITTAREMSKELGKLDEYSEEEKENIFRIIGLGALKYYILKVDPKKNMLFDPVESIDFNGNTGPFIQYTYARIRSVLRKAEGSGIKPSPNSKIKPNPKEIELIKILHQLQEVVETAAVELNPSVIANYLYELAREYNQFYHDFSILKAGTDESVRFRLILSEVTANTIKKGMWLMGIEVPERM
jgi:arginyl-tRNA synthetase